MKAALILVSLLMLSVCEGPPSSKDPDHILHDHANSNSRAASPIAAWSGSENAQKELQFIDTAVAAHELLIEMALLVNTRSLHPEMKSFSNDMLKAERLEANRLRALRARYFGEPKQAVSPRLLSMDADEANANFVRLDSAKADIFDKEFTEQAINIYRAVDAMTAEFSPTEQYAEIKNVPEENAIEQKRIVERLHKLSEGIEKRPTR